MKFIKILFIVLVFSFTWMGCDDDKNNIASDGGHGDSPQEIGQNDNLLVGGNDPGITGDGDNDPGNDDDGDLDDDDSDDLGDGSSDSEDDDDESDGDNGSDDDDSDDGDGTVSGKCDNRSIVLDASNGKWYETPKKELMKKKSYNKVIVQIKAIRKEIKELKKEKESEGADKARIKAKVKELRLDIRQLRDTIGFGRIQKGIHTYWANQNLYFKVLDNCKAGWYKLIVIAKNYGDSPLPDFYKNFNVSVRNEDSGENLGGIHVGASDAMYNRGRMLVRLEEGDTLLNLLWTNDAYRIGEYDANIQIRRVILKYKGQKAPRRGLVSRAHQYSFVDGKWFWDDDSVTAYSANQTIGFTFNNLTAGKYKVTVYAKNNGTLPPKFKKFNLSVESDDGAKGDIKINADENKYKKGHCFLDLTGPNTIYLTWTNDESKDGEYDTNIQIEKIVLKLTGESKRSALAAYMLTKASKNKPVILIFMSVVAMLGGIFVWNKKKSKAQS